jgi:hypothetical protein
MASSSVRDHFVGENFNDSTGRRNNRSGKARYNVAISQNTEDSKQSRTSEVVIEQTPKDLQSNPVLAKAESQLRRAWNLLSPQQKESLNDGQELWIRVYDNSSDEAKLSLIRDRTLYLLNEGNKK